MLNSTNFKLNVVRKTKHFRRLLATADRNTGTLGKESNRSKDRYIGEFGKY